MSKTMKAFKDNQQKRMIQYKQVFKNSKTMKAFRVNNVTLKAYQSCVNIEFVAHVHYLHHKQINAFLRLSDTENLLCMEKR